MFRLLTYKVEVPRRKPNDAGLQRSYFRSIRTRSLHNLNILVAESLGEVRLPASCNRTCFSLSTSHSPAALCRLSRRESPCPATLRSREIQRSPHPKQTPARGGEPACVSRHPRLKTFAYKILGPFDPLGKKGPPGWTCSALLAERQSAATALGPPRSAPRYSELRHTDGNLLINYLNS